MAHCALKEEAMGEELREFVERASNRYCYKVQAHDIQPYMLTMITRFNKDLCKTEVVVGLREPKEESVENS